MRSANFHQTVVDPDDLSHLETAVQKAIAEAGPLVVSKRVRLRQLVTTILHPLGVHHWVRMRTFDPRSQRIIRTNDWVCTICPAAREGSHG